VFDIGKDETGKRRQLTRSGFLTQREAQDALAQAIAGHQGQPVPVEEKPIPTFRAFTERWFTESNPRDWSPKTLERAKELAENLTRPIGFCKLLIM
jgi:hypothetical protein